MSLLSSSSKSATGVKTYKLPQVLHSCIRPSLKISILNGIIMGGGAGASVHGRLRVATENLVFAMSETTLGLFLDVLPLIISRSFLDPLVMLVISLVYICVSIAPPANVAS